MIISDIQKEANSFCNLYLEDEDKYYRMYKNYSWYKLDYKEAYLLSQFTQIYINVKTNLITREEAIAQQKLLCEFIYK